MECFIVETSDVLGQKLLLRSDEAKHAARSLRMRVGEEILATNLAGICYRCSIESIEEVGRGDFEIECSIIETQPNLHEPGIDVLLIQAILNQPSKFEEIVERTTEIGVLSIIPIISERVERNNLKPDRLEKILRSACKQSHRSQKPSLGEAMHFDSALSEAFGQRRFIVLLHEGADPKLSLKLALSSVGYRSIALVVGPEGGFTESEVKIASETYGAEIASLGTRRLRAETAAISAVAVAIS